MNSPSHRTTSSLRHGMKAGNIYYIVMYADEQLTVPVVQTLKYQEMKTREDGSTHFLFGRFLADGTTEKFFINEPDLDSLLLDGTGLLQRLRDCFGGKLLRNRPSG